MLLALCLLLLYTLLPMFVKLDVKEAFYAKPTSVADKCPKRDIHIVLQDFNVVSSCDQAGYKMSFDHHGSGVDLSF